MEESLLSIFDRWLQGRINVCIDGLMSRISYLEEENTRLSERYVMLLDRTEHLSISKMQLESDIRDLYRENESLKDRLVERTPDQELESFADRVYECFDSTEFRDAVGEKIADYIENDDNGYVTYSGLEDWINDQRFTLKVR